MNKNLNMLQEIHRTSLPTAKTEDYELKGRNSILCLRTDQGLQIIDFSYNLRCYFRTLDLNFKFIPNPKSSVASDFVTNRFYKKLRSNLEIGEILVDPSLWIANRDIVEEMANVADFQLSPSGMRHDYEVLLATVTNIGNVELFTRHKQCWKSIFSVSQTILTHYKSSSHLEVPSNYKELKCVTGMLETSTVCWSPIVTNNSCLLCTAQKNGAILFWVISNADSDVKAEFAGKIQSLSDIFTLDWVPISESEFILFCSSVSGEVNALNCKIQDNVINLVNSTSLWSHKDRMIAKSISHRIINDKIIVIYGKYRHLVAQMIDKSCTVLSQFVENIDDYKITSINGNNSLTYMSTEHKLYKIDINVLENQLNVNVRCLELNDLQPTYEIYSIVLSNNCNMLMIAALDRKVSHSKKRAMIEVVFLKTSDVCEAKQLVENSTKLLEEQWDFIELIRFRTMKSRSLPSLDYNQLYQDSQKDIKKLRIYLIFAILYETLENYMKNNSRNMLPETSVEKIKEKIFVLHAIQILNDLADIYNENGKFNEDIQRDSYLGAKSYLKSYCKKYKVNINELISNSILNLIDARDNFMCQFCDNYLEDLQCKNNHLNTLCSLTFTPITNDEYLVCKSCNSIGRIEMYNYNPKCIFCDIHMNKC